MNYPAIVEFRQYTLRPGMREALVDLFEAHLVESQEELNMSVLGIFRDLDKPDAFVWLRGFPDMATRAASLASFYYGPVWKQHRGAANETMLDSDNVLLLRPARDDSGLVFDGTPAPKRDGALAERGAVEVIVCSFANADAAEHAVSHLESAAIPAIVAAGGSVLAYFVTEKSPNNFPALPVRADEHVLLAVLGYRDREAYELGSPALEAARAAMASEKALLSPPEVIRLTPTDRSRLSGTSGGCAGAERSQNEEKTP